MSAHEDEEEEGTVEGEDQGKLNEQLLEACRTNITELALELIERSADPCCEDQKYWSPLMWAASHGNEPLARELIGRGAAMIYSSVPDESGAARPRRPHTPLHWAAFKGHTKVLWLLMAPPHKLDVNQKDTIGNTVLHQAAAGGSTECVRSIMSQGVDVFAKNDRGHTPFILCTEPAIQELLQRAMQTSECTATKKQFSSTVLRYMCSWSLDVFCESSVTRTFVYESPDAPEKERPVSWCNEVRDIIQAAESLLSDALRSNELDAIDAALEAAEGKPVDCKLAWQCCQAKERLESEIRLGEAMEVQTLESLEGFSELKEVLEDAIADSLEKGVDEARLVSAKGLLRKLVTEASLMRALEGTQKTTVGHITMLTELRSAAESEGANPELLGKAARLIAKQKCEREVQRCIEEAMPLNGITSFKDIAGKENLPPWCFDTEQFDAFHEEYKRVMEDAERDEISTPLLNRAFEQLSGIEQLLVEKKQLDEEAGMRKKKGK